MTTKNKIAGSGQHSHEVPSAIGRVVVMRDGGHEGTEVYRVAVDEFRFVSLDHHSVTSAERCVLVQLTGVNLEDLYLEEPYACDLDSPDGLALIGDPGNVAPGIVLWDSTTDY